MGKSKASRASAELEMNQDTERLRIKVDVLLHEIGYAEDKITQVQLFLAKSHISIYVMILVAVSAIFWQREKPLTQVTFGDVLLTPIDITILVPFFATGMQAYLLFALILHKEMEFYRLHLERELRVLIPELKAPTHYQEHFVERYFFKNKPFVVRATQFGIFGLFSGVIMPVIVIGPSWYAMHYGYTYVKDPRWILGWEVLVGMLVVFNTVMLGMVGGKSNVDGPIWRKVSSKTFFADEIRKRKIQ